MRQLMKIMAYLPTRIPVGLTEFTAWLDSVVSLAGPIADSASLKWVVCNEIMRLPPGKDRVSKQTFVRLLRKYAANQLAAHTVNQLKAEQDAKQAAESAAKQQLEATVPTDNQSGEEKSN